VEIRASSDDFRDGKRTSLGLPGRTALVMWVLGTLVVACVLAVLGLRRQPIDYLTADGAMDAMRQAAIYDTRYLAVASNQPSVPLPPDRSFPPEEPLEIGRDVRLIPPAPPALTDKQQAYLTRYNGTMTELLRAELHGQPVRRPAPLSAAMWVITAMLVMAPFLVSLYLRYRLGRYRLDGRTWTYTLWDLTWEYMRPSTYSEGAWPLLLLLWIDAAFIVPWVFLIVSAIHNRPLP